MTEPQDPLMSPITPSDEILKQWRGEATIAIDPTLDSRDYVFARENWIADKASQWGWQQRDADIEAEAEIVWIRPDYQVLYSNLARKLTLIHSSFITENTCNRKAFDTTCEAMELIGRVEKVETKNSLTQQQHENS